MSKSSDNNQQVVIFDPIGGYRHFNHIAVHKATVMALTPRFHVIPDGAPGSRIKLYPVMSRKMLKIAVKVFALSDRTPGGSVGTGT
jgi:LmbE family N-acetylglucosaminyl deacetylase